MASKNTKSAKQPEKRLITAALPYINNIPHLGHIVGSHLPADIFARFCRARGYETLFVGGSDENGSPCEIAAEKLKVPIQKFLDTLYEEHRKIYEWFGISYDNFSRTSRPIHHTTTKEIFKKIYDSGFITAGKIPVFYSSSEDRFLADRYVIGECPKCGYEKTNGDQCERCLEMLEPTALINPKSTLTGNLVEIREVEHLFLDLKKLSPELKKWIGKQKQWRRQVSSLALGWIKEGLRPRGITRDLKHGVSVPLKDFTDKVFYVWFDAPIGYVTATKEALPNKWEDFWKKDSAKTYQFLGKDNIPFHTLFWPGVIMAHGELTLPYQIVGLQYLIYEGGKFSKSKKHGVFCERLPELNLSADVWRAYLTQIIPETSDSEFKWNEFRERINSDILGNLGNFYNRVFTFIQNKFESSIKKPGNLEFDARDKKLLASLEKKSSKITKYLEACEIRKAFFEILSLSSEGNKYFNDTEPWKTIKENPSEANRRLYLCANLARSLSIFIAPFMPSIAEKAWKQIGLKGKVDEVGSWDTANSLEILDNHTIGKVEPLFKQISDEDIEEYKAIVAEGKELEDLF